MLTFYFIFSLFLSVAYVWLIRFYLQGWHALPEWRVPEGWQPATKVTVLIPARNEAGRIRACVESVLSQSYPADLLQLIVIDDHSEDATAGIVTAINHPSLALLSLSSSSRKGKKAALTEGVQAARGELILTTDADCVAPPDWLALMVSYYDFHHPAFLAGPVNFFEESNVLEHFQSLDLQGMMVLTGGGLARGFTHLSNGANLAFPRVVFEAVGGYRDIDHLASGDDMLLMHKIAVRHPGRVAFLKQAGATVRTHAMPTVRAFLQQRLRWATKSHTYQDRRILPVILLVFFQCFAILTTLLLIPFFGWSLLFLFALQLGAKSLADYFLLHTATGFFGRRELLRHFWPAQAGHILYLTIVGLMSQVVTRYEWKGRRVH